MGYEALRRIAMLEATSEPIIAGSGKNRFFRELEIECPCMVYDRISVTTWHGSTPTSRWSRPWKRKLSFS